MKVFITGDSNVGTLRHGLGASLQAAKKRGDTAPPDIEIAILGLANGSVLRSRFFEDCGDHARIINPRPRTPRLPPEGTKYDWIGFSGPLRSTWFWSSDWQDFRPALLKSHNGPVMSNSLLRQIIDDGLEHMLSLIEIVRRTTPVFVTEAPWPFRHHPSVTSYGEDFVAYMHNLYRSHVMAVLAARNIPVVEIDSSWADAAGFMKPEHRGEDERDRQHGNAELGKLMLARIEDFLRAQK